MRCHVGQVAMHYVQHGEGQPMLVLHGAQVDHREAEASFEPLLDRSDPYRRIYPDLPGMGLSSAPPSLQSGDDVLETLYGFVDAVVGQEPVLVAGHSAGAHYARGFAARWPDHVAGLALICPLLSGAHDIPDHHPVVAGEDLGDEGFRQYFVVQTPAMLDRYERFVAPALPLADQASAQRIGTRWELTLPGDPTYHGPTLIVAGRQDSTVGFAAAVDLLHDYPQAALAVLDGAGHALLHEQPDLLRALVRDWLTRTRG